MAATDRRGGGINTLINNYVKNDTGYTGGGVGWAGGDTEGHVGVDEKCGGEYFTQSDSDGKASGQDGNKGGVEGRKWARHERGVRGRWGRVAPTSTDHLLNIQAAQRERGG